MKGSVKKSRVSAGGQQPYFESPLLRGCGARASEDCAAEKNNELSPPHVG
jgi:hypothetical protein